MIIETRSAKETYDLGKKIGSHAKAGEVYTLVGDLGVGKTVFTQGLAKGLVTLKRWTRLVLKTMYMETV